MMNIYLAKFILKFFDVLDWIRANIKKVILAIIVIFALSIITFVTIAEKTTHIPSQILMAEISFIRSGEKKIPVDLKIINDEGEGYYSSQNLYNSKWMEIETSKIVPFFSYDGLTDNPVYPTIVGVIPYDPDQSETVAGYEFLAPSLGRIIMINDRYQYDQSWNDERDLLGTFTHELIHAQGGGFDNQDDGPEVFEAKTQAASTEILASMCNMQDELACKAFWLDMFNYSRAYVRGKLDNYGMDWAYEAWNRVFFWNSSDMARYDKRTRYWSNDKEEMEYILRAYSINPYVKYLVPAVYNYGIDTELPDTSACAKVVGFCYTQPEQTIKFVFDDTKYQLGWMWILLPPPFNY